MSNSRYDNFMYFYEPSEFMENLLIVSDGMGEITNKNFQIDRNYLNNHVFIFVLEGEFHLEQYGQHLTINSNEGILMTLKHPHKYYFNKNIKSKIHWFHFRGQPSNSIMNTLIHYKKLPLIFPMDSTTEIVNDIFTQAMQKSESRNLNISSLIYKILIGVCKDAILTVSRNSSDFDKLKFEIASFIDNNLDRQLSLALLAKEFNMSSSHFSRTFKNYFGTTPFNYIKIKKIETAKKMLIDTSYSIAEISNYLCFYDQGYFTNVFKCITGVSPRTYRNSQHEIY